MSFALSQYRSARTTTASPVAIVVQLYDAAIRHLTDGVEAINERDAKRRGVSLGKAHRIVSELQATLDESHAPELCAQLFALYDYCLAEIMKANTKWDANAGVDARKVLRELRSAWAEIAARG